MSGQRAHSSPQEMPSRRIGFSGAATTLGVGRRAHQYQHVAIEHRGFVHSHPLVTRREEHTAGGKRTASDSLVCPSFIYISCSCACRLPAAACRLPSAACRLPSPPAALPSAACSCRLSCPSLLPSAPAVFSCPSASTGLGRLFPRLAKHRRMQSRRHFCRTPCCRARVYTAARSGFCLLLCFSAVQFSDHWTRLQRTDEQPRPLLTTSQTTSLIERVRSIH